jgi:hypothetical protein
MRKPFLVSCAIARFRSYHRFLHGPARSSTSHSTSALADVRLVLGAMKILLMNCLTVYCNSLLATLNARKGLRGRTGHEEISLSHCQVTQQKTNLETTSKVGFLRNGEDTVSLSPQRVPNNMCIKIDTTHEYVRDEVSSTCKGTLVA